MDRIKCILIIVLLVVTPLSLAAGLELTIIGSGNTVEKLSFPDMPPTPNGAFIVLKGEKGEIWNVEFVSKTIEFKRNNVTHAIPISELASIAFSDAPERDGATIRMRNGSELRKVRYIPEEIIVDCKNLGRLHFSQSEVRYVYIIEALKIKTEIGK